MLDKNPNNEKLDEYNPIEELELKKRKRLILMVSFIIIFIIIIVLIIVLTTKSGDTNSDSTDSSDPSDSNEPSKDPQEVPSNYMELQDNRGELEKIFSKMGEYKIDKKNIKLSESQKYNYFFFYPKKENQAQINEDTKYPIIIFLNNIGKSYEINEPIFNHLASYGFVVIANDDKNTSDGESIKEIKNNLEKLNNNENFILYHRLDLNNIGISCHDQSIISLLKITNDISLRQKIKSVFCAAPLSQKDILLKKHYDFYRNMTFKNIFLITPLKDNLFPEPKAFINIIMEIPRNTYEKALVSMRNITTRDNILWKADSYHTAWYLSTLKNNETANKIFNATKGEISRNTIWNNTKIRSEKQILQGDAAIYIADNFRDYVNNDENTLEKKYGEKGSYSYGTYEVLCDPNLDKCLKNGFFNYKIYYPLELTHNDKKYPLIVFSNALNYGYYYITPLLEHLASWGFVVIANDEGKSYLSIGIRESLRYMIQLNNDTNSIFFDKIDMDNIGFSGHSAGASGVLYYTNFECQDELKNLKIKSLFPSCINTLEMIQKYFGISIDFTKVNIPYIFLTSSEQELDQISDANFTEKYLYKFRNNEYQFIARKRSTMHHNFYWNSVGYQTAWFLYTLANNEEAKTIFEPKPSNDYCENDKKNGICSNPLWFHILYQKNNINSS